MTCHLINQGHSEIGFIKGHKDHGATQHRLDGYLGALSDNNIVVNKDNITEPTIDEPTINEPTIDEID